MVRNQQEFTMELKQYASKEQEWADLNRKLFFCSEECGTKLLEEKAPAFINHASIKLLRELMHTALEQDAFQLALTISYALKWR